MRVTAQAKALTRKRILDAAARLFEAHGFDACTTRQIADAAEIAAGTLFNYFQSKEAVLAALVADAAEAAREQAERQSARPATDHAGLEEELFAFVMLGLRKLKPFRRLMPALLQTALSPLLTARIDGESLRASQLQSVADVARRHGYGELCAVALQLYWTLYTGVLVFWAADRSPRQEDTLALLDESLSMFVGWLQADRAAGDLSRKGDEPCPRPSPS